MKLLRKKVTIETDSFFNTDGKVNLTHERAIFLDAILIIMVNKKQSIKLSELQYELLHCGFFISHPELKQVVIHLMNEGLISDPSISLN